MNKKKRVTDYTEDSMFVNRRDAAEQLARRLQRFKTDQCVVVAIPRGGVILGEVIARKLDCPMGIVLVRKIGHPQNSEYAVCAVSKNRLRCFGEEKVLGSEWLESETEKERKEIARREELYLKGVGSVDLKSKTVILVDDGVATGATYLVALEEVLRKRPKAVVVALPVMPFDFMEKVKNLASEVVCLCVDENYLGAVGAYYADFPQVSDEEVVRAMALASNEEMSRT